MEDALVLFGQRYPKAKVSECLNPCFNGRCTRTYYQKKLRKRTIGVLILVLMEDALVHLEKVVKKFGKGSLNPCFNGRCTRTLTSRTIQQVSSCLNPSFNGRCTRTRKKFQSLKKRQIVLILVLMEDALVQVIGRIFMSGNKCLNPCFNGRCTRTDGRK